MGMPLPSNEFANVSAVSDSMPSTAEGARSLALQLALERRQVDEEIQSHLSTLKEQEATMTSPLLDSQGFPLATTDIVAVRTARSRIIALKNDREALEARLQSLLEVALAKKDAQEGVGPSPSLNLRSEPRRDVDSGTGTAWGRINGRSDGLSMIVDTQEGSVDDWRQVGGLQAFAKINSVADSSPAQHADLHIGDEILSFADLDATTAHRSASRKDLGNLPSAVQEGREILIMILRQNESGQKSIKQLRLTPASGWGGRGLLGCHIVPL